MPIFLCDKTPTKVTSPPVNEKIVIVENRLLSDNEKILVTTQQKTEGKYVLEERRKVEEMTMDITESTSHIEYSNPLQIIHLENNNFNNTEDKTKKLSTNESKIDEYLTNPKTPERKGKRQSERAPFVLTSTTYKKMVEEKERIKEEKERQKEENKRKRLLKSLESKKTITKGKKGKASNSKQTNTKENCAPKLKTEYPDKNISNTEILPKENSSVIEKRNNEEHHVRCLFEESPEKQNLEPTNNISCFKGLCFICGNNIYFKNKGIQCQKCTRTYHIRCLQKYKQYEEFFYVKHVNLYSTKVSHFQCKH